MTIIGHPLTRWAVGLFLVYYVLHDPAGAAGTVHWLGGLLSGAGQHLSAFTSDLGGH